jgi:hypothetical protein
MNIQDIIVYILIGAALFQVVVATYKMIKVPKSGSSHCSGCIGSCELKK